MFKIHLFYKETNSFSNNGTMVTLLPFFAIKCIKKVISLSLAFSNDFF